MESASSSPAPRAGAIDLRWVLSVAAGGIFALLLILTASPFQHPSSALLYLSSQSSPSAASSSSSSPRRPLPPLYVESALSRPAPAPSSAAAPPRFAYLISGSAGDAGMLRRCLLALYHPRNSYILHLDAQAPDADRAQLAAFVAAHPVLAAAGNVRVIERANLVTYRGPTMVTTTLHAAAAFLRGRDGKGRAADWDWFINLSASDYPLVTQDDLMHVFSKLPRDLNFIDHTSNLSWKAYARAMPVIIDPGLYKKTKADLFWVPERRELPTAFKLFTGSAWMVLSRPFVEYLIWGWDNLPRTVLMYYANFISSPEGYFHTVACNAEQFRNTTVNSDLHFISWDNPPMQHPHYLTVDDWDRMLASDAPFARKFPRDGPVLDKIDAEILARGPGMLAPGGWCAGGSGGREERPDGNSSGDNDPCSAVGNATLLRPGPGAERLQRLVTSLLSEENFRPRQCVLEEEQNPKSP